MGAGTTLSRSRDGMPVAAALVIALALGGTSAGCGRRSAGTTAPPGAAGGADVSVAFSDLRGIQADLAGRSGRAVLVNFWATWCGPCVEEMPRLAAASREAAGADFVGISVDAWVTGEGEETLTKVRSELARAGVGYTNFIYRGDQDPLVNAFHLPGPIPYSILYDRKG